MSDGRWLLPDSWGWAQADDVAEIVGGGTPPSKDLTNFLDQGIPWITPSDLTGYDGIYISRGARDLSPKGYAGSGAQLMPAGTVLFSSRAPIGYCVIAENDICTNQGFKSLVLHNGLIPEYIRYYLISSKDYAELLASGTTFKELSGSRMATFSIPVAPTNEQNRIVTKLEQLFAHTRRARKELRKIPPLVERYKYAVLSAAFRGDLTADWRIKNPINQSGEELREKLLESHKASVESSHRQRTRQENFDFPDTSQLPDLPESWTWLPVSKIATQVVDGVHKKPNYIEKGIPFLTVKNLTAGPFLDFDNCKYISPQDHEEFIRRTHPEKGDILISKDGTLGVTRAVRTDHIFSIFVSVALVKPVDRGMTDYLELAFQSPQLQEQMIGVGTGLQHIHLVDLKRDLIPIAPEKEREEIVCRIHKAFKKIDKIKEEAICATRLLDHLDQANLSKAFRGELVPQDPSDEPASTLLDRIRAERAGQTNTRRSRRNRNALEEGAAV